LISGNPSELSDVLEAMIQRRCPECNGEATLTRLPNTQHGPRILEGSATYRRCSICGRGVTAQQIRKNKRPKSARHQARARRAYNPADKATVIDQNGHGSNSVARWFLYAIPDPASELGAMGATLQIRNMWDHFLFVASIISSLLRMPLLTTPARSSRLRTVLNKRK
jgi:hypothetical protein